MWHNFLITVPHTTAKNNVTISAAWYCASTEMYLTYPTWNTEVVLGYIFPHFQGITQQPGNQWIRFYPLQHNENVHLLCSGGISVGIVTHLQSRRTNQNHPQITGPPLTCQIHCILTTQLPMASSTTRWIKTPQITWIWVFIGPKIEFYRAITTCFVNLVLLIILTISPNIIHIIIIA